jgi:hypothetical protein
MKAENMSTLAVVEEILRAVKRPVSVREIVEAAGERLPTRSKTPDTVVARDLSMDIKKKGDESRFVRTSPGRYTMREFVTPATAGEVVSASRTQDRVGPRSAGVSALEAEGQPRASTQG